VPPTAAPTPIPAGSKPTSGSLDLHSPDTSPANKPSAAAPTAAPAPQAAATGVKLATLDQELAMPADVLAVAKKEGKLAWVSSIDEDAVKVVHDAFHKRYPEIEVQYQEASEEIRTVRTLTEFKAGRTRLDVVMGVGGFMKEYRDAQALTPLADLPGYANYESPYRDPEHGWIGVRLQYWGVGYNTEKVKESELPKGWDDFTDPRWKGRLGLGDRPQLWVQQLWKNWGPDRTTTFLQKLFANQPQRRKEGLDASATLLAAGEFDVYIPAAPYRIQNLKQTGGAVGWTSPEPLTTAVSEMVILQRSPNPNAAKVFVNWFISREGQAIYAKTDNTVPTHPLIRTDPEYLGMFADRFVGRPSLIRVPEDELLVMPSVREVWSKLWTS
jgi:ABC-type Fe3+ transport system substrate-binding protein